MNWKDPIGAVTSGAGQLTSMAEQYWIHASVAVGAIVIIVMVLILRSGI